MTRMDFAKPVYASPCQITYGLGLRTLKPEPAHVGLCLGAQKAKSRFQRALVKSTLLQGIARCLTTSLNLC